MNNVQIRPSRDLRNNYKEISSLVKEHNPVVITNGGKGDTVLISMEDYADYEDYMHHMFIVSELKKAETKALDPTTKWYTQEELWGKILSWRNKSV